MLFSFASMLAAAAITGPFHFEKPLAKFDAAVALRVCREVDREVQVDFRGDGAPLLVQQRSCPEEDPDLGGLVGGILVAKDWPEPLLLAAGYGFSIVGLTALRTGLGEVLLIEQLIGQHVGAVFSVLGLHRGGIRLLRPPDLSRGLRAGEVVEGDDVQPRGDLLVGHLVVCAEPYCHCCLPARARLLVGVRPDPARGVLRLVSLRRTRREREP